MRVVYLVSRWDQSTVSHGNRKLSSDILLEFDKMASKVIYFTVAGKEEQAEFSSDDCQQDITGGINTIN